MSRPCSLLLLACCCCLLLAAWIDLLFDAYILMHWRNSVCCCGCCTSINAHWTLTEWTSKVRRLLVWPLLVVGTWILQQEYWLAAWICTYLQSSCIVLCGRKMHTGIKTRALLAEAFRSPCCHCQKAETPPATRARARESEREQERERERTYRLLAFMCSCNQTISTDCYAVRCSDYSYWFEGGRVAWRDAVQERVGRCCRKLGLWKRRCCDLSMEIDRIYIINKYVTLFRALRASAVRHIYLQYLIHGSSSSFRILRLIFKY